MIYARLITWHVCRSQQSPDAHFASPFNWQVFSSQHSLLQGAEPQSHSWTCVNISFPTLPRYSHLACLHDAISTLRLSARDIRLVHQTEVDASGEPFREVLQAALGPNRVWDVSNLRIFSSNWLTKFQIPRRSSHDARFGVARALADVGVGVVVLHPEIVPHLMSDRWSDSDSVVSMILIVFRNYICVNGQYPHHIDASRIVVGAHRTFEGLANHTFFKSTIPEQILILEIYTNFHLRQEMSVIMWVFFEEFLPVVEEMIQCFVARFLNFDMVLVIPNLCVHQWYSYVQGVIQLKWNMF